jgi:hypothetical protein
VRLEIYSRVSAVSREAVIKSSRKWTSSFLFDDERKLFPIGYNVTASRKDDGYYDLLASEARLASFIAIAKGDVPQEHWFRMGRPLTTVGGARALISWTEPCLNT